MSSPKVYSSLIIESEDTEQGEIVETAEKEFKNVVLKIISDQKEDSNEEMSEVGKAI